MRLADYIRQDDFATDLAFSDLRKTSPAAARFEHAAGSGVWFQFRVGSQLLRIPPKWPNSLWARDSRSP